MLVLMSLMEQFNLSNANDDEDNKKGLESSGKIIIKQLKEEWVWNKREIYN